MVHSCAWAAPVTFDRRRSTKFIICNICFKKKLVLCGYLYYYYLLTKIYSTQLGRLYLYFDNNMYCQIDFLTLEIGKTYNKDLR